jgi:hypothetical protein
MRPQSNAAKRSSKRQGSGSQIHQAQGMEMAEQIRKHPRYGQVRVLQQNSFLAEIETEGGDTFWIQRASFSPKPVKKRVTKRKKAVVQQVDKPDELLVPALDLDLQLPDGEEAFEDGMPPIEVFEDDVEDDAELCESE